MYSPSIRSILRKVRFPLEVSLPLSLYGTENQVFIIVRFSPERLDIVRSSSGTSTGLMVLQIDVDSNFLWDCWFEELQMA